MTGGFETVLRGGAVVNHEGEGVRDIGLRDGRIAEIGTIAPGAGGQEIDCRGLHVLPGVIDSQVHFREPGPTHKEDLESGSRAAVLGGVTCVFEMPNTDPLTTDEAALADKIRRGHHRMHCDFAFWVGGTRENAADVAELERLPGAAGIKVFMGSSTGSLLVEDDEGVREILKRTRRRAAFHSEDEFRLRERLGLRVEGDPASHPIWRDELAALQCTERLVGIAEETGARIHVLHISTAEEILFLGRHKANATCEATPHHLTLSAEDYARLGTKLQMNPPVRDARHRDGVWFGIAQGIVDVLGSDHAPHTLEEKSKPYPASPSGMPGVQTLLPLLLDHAANGRLTLQRVIELTSAGAQRIFGIVGKGRIVAGYDADFTVVDLKKRWTIEERWLASRSGWSPFTGMELTGKPIGTVVRGEIAMWEDQLGERAQGAPIRFEATAFGR